MSNSDRIKKVALVVDNYKLEKYLKTLKEMGYENGIEVKIYADDISSISVPVPANKVQDIHKMCRKLEFEFKNSN